MGIVFIRPAHVVVTHKRRNGWNIYHGGGGRVELIIINRTTICPSSKASRIVTGQFAYYSHGGNGCAPKLKTPFHYAHKINGSLPDRCRVQHTYDRARSRVLHSIYWYTYAYVPLGPTHCISQENWQCWSIISANVVKQ